MKRRLHAIALVWTYRTCVQLLAMKKLLTGWQKGGERKREKKCDAQNRVLHSFVIWLALVLSAACFSRVSFERTSCEILKFLFRWFCDVMMWCDGTEFGTRSICIILGKYKVWSTEQRFRFRLIEMRFPWASNIRYMIYMKKLLCQQIEHRQPLPACALAHANKRQIGTARGWECGEWMSGNENVFFSCCLWTLNASIQRHDFDFVEI